MRFVAPLLILILLYPDFGSAAGPHRANKKQHRKTPRLEKSVKKVTKKYSHLLKTVKSIASQYEPAPDELEEPLQDEPPYDPTKDIDAAWLNTKEALKLVANESQLLSRLGSNPLLNTVTKPVTTALTSSLTSLLNFRRSEQVRLTTYVQIKLLKISLDAAGSLFMDSTSSCLAAESVLDPPLRSIVGGANISSELLAGSGLPDPDTVVDGTNVQLYESARILKTQISSTRQLLDRLRILSINNSSATLFRNLLNTQNRALYIPGVMDTLRTGYDRHGGREFRYSSVILNPLLLVLETFVDQFLLLHEDSTQAFDPYTEEVIAFDLLGYTDWLEVIKGWGLEADSQSVFIASLGQLLETASRDLSTGTTGHVLRISRLQTDLATLNNARNTLPQESIETRIASHGAAIDLAEIQLEGLYGLLLYRELPQLPNEDVGEGDEDWTDYPDVDTSPEIVEQELADSIFKAMKESKSKKLTRCFFKDNKGESTTLLSMEAVSKCLKSKSKRRKIHSKDLLRLKHFLDKTAKELDSYSFDEF